MFRYALIIVLFIIVLIYLLWLLTKGGISGRFRTVSLSLLVVLLVLLGTGIYYNYRHYSLQTVEEEFSSRKQSIIQKIQDNYRNREYTEARKLAQEYKGVQDKDLEAWYIKSRVAELLQMAEQLAADKNERLYSIYSELFELTREKKYQNLAQEQKKKIQQKKEEKLLEQVRAMPAKAIGRKKLGYALLLQINPDNPEYKQKLDLYSQRIESTIQNSPWKDVCTSSNPDYCKHVGYLASLPSNAANNQSEQGLGEVLGISWRPKGTRINKQGKTAPSEGYYYIVRTDTALRLFNVDYIQVKNPYNF